MNGGKPKKATNGSGKGIERTRRKNGNYAINVTYLALTPCLNIS